VEQHAEISLGLLVNNDTKNKLTSGTDQVDLTSGNACWETPPLVFEKLNNDFGPFDVDLTADAQRHLCPIWFGPGSPVPDALGCLWAAWMALQVSHSPKGYSNPPYGPFVQKLLAKAKQEAACGVTSVLLLPMRVTKAFHAHVLNGASELWFCDRRITFFEDGVPRLHEKKWVQDGKAVADPAVFDSILVVYRAGIRAVQPSVWCWQVPKHVTADDLARAVARRSTAVATPESGLRGDPVGRLPMEV
jgi:hypothetical protein